MSFFGILFISLRSVVHTLCAYAEPKGVAGGWPAAKNWALEQG